MSTWSPRWTSPRPDRSVGEGRDPDRRPDADDRSPLVPFGDDPTAPPEAVDLERLRRSEPHWLNLPNALTFLRALLVPVILWLVAQDDATDATRWWAFGIFVFAAWTDSIDGWVARRLHGVTRWGQLADPIADKLLIIGCLGSLAVVGELPWWAVNVIVARELAVTLLRVRLVRGLDLVMPASSWGKAKTVSQVVAVAAFLWPGVGDGVRTALLNVAVLLTVWSGIEYAFRAGRLARGVRREP
ncbi:CDP-diacylglycerol--glycerol-3-phosphate 3-phosphatidyltransferase [Nitriliruptoraceae bacterium ZYF776]|nr:CDP-diacylglycerol--glycerol-3-phosphate 3-phosphatidyltransferase [Profundirhabdus halotolerans]